jgi:hypothetical protein
MSHLKGRGGARMAPVPPAEVASAATADADAFASRLEALAATLPKPSVLPLARSGDEDGTAAAKAFEEVVSIEKHTTWYSSGKRHLHQPQLEALAGLVIAPMVRARGENEPRVLLELGAGRALLGRVVANLTGATLVAVDRRRAGEVSSRPHHDSHEADEEDGEEVLEVKNHSSPDTEMDNKTRRVVADLTKSLFSDLLPDARVKTQTETHGAVVVAKHLCAGATDAALRLCLTGGTCVRAVALAPCCHPQIKWDEYSGKEWLMGRWGGFGETEFTKMLALVAYSKERAGTSALTLERYHSPTLGVLANIPGGAARLRRLGRKARVVVETGRAFALRNGGFEDAKVCRYVDAGVSPDNLVVIAGTAADIKNVCGNDQARAARKILPFGVPIRGVVVHVNAAGGAANGSLSKRLAEYLLEHRGRCFRNHDADAYVSSVTPTVAQRPHGEATQREKKQKTQNDPSAPPEKRARVDTTNVGTDPWESLNTVPGDDNKFIKNNETKESTGNALVPACMIGGDPCEILNALTAGDDNKFVTQCVGMLCPFDSCLVPETGARLSMTLERLVAQVVTSLDSDRVSIKVRLSAFPRSLEPALVAAFASTEINLHPTQFTHTLNVTQWFSNPDDTEKEDDEYALLWCVLRRDEWDPNGWRQKIESTSDDKQMTRASRALVTSLGECMHRLPAHLGDDFQMKNIRKILLVTDDGEEVENALKRWCFETAGAKTVVVARPRREKSSGDSGDTWDIDFEEYPTSVPLNFTSVSLCVFRLGRCFDDIAAILKQVSLEYSPSHGADAPRRLAPNAWFVGPGVKLGRLARHRRVADRVVATLKQNGFEATKVLHLCSDREQERTVACRNGSAQVGLE